jgi:hypothetical protein|tara:strand:- start:439 stop:894 length:456 start_codon:yes stop_codon:yes gene_type:complete
MKDNTLYMFIDEGGNFDFSPNGTKYFTLSCLTEKRPFPSYDKLREIKYDLIEDGINIEYFHASTDKQFVRDMVSSVIQGNIDNIKVDSMIVQKNKTYPALYPEEKFYNMVFEMLMKWERGDARSYELIKKAVDAEWDVFRKGTTIYYDYKK